VGDGGGDWAFSWGRQEADESIAAMHAALDAVFVYDARFALQHPPRFTKTCRWPVILASRKAILIKLKLSARPVAARSAGQNEQWNGWIKKLVGVADDWQLC